MQSMRTARGRVKKIKLSRTKKAKATLPAPPAADGRSNWDKLQARLAPPKNGGSAGNKASASDVDGPKKKNKETTARAPAPVGDSDDLTAVVAVDCEMVGVGPRRESALAQVVVVNNHGRIVYSSYCRPKQRVTDYRTRVSGVTPAHLADAPPTSEVRARVAELLRGRIVVGHAVHHDFAALGVPHPPRDVRDTATYPPLMSRHGGAGAEGEEREGRLRPRALRHLSAEFLGVEIQTGRHDPVDDARREGQAWAAVGRAASLCRLSSRLPVIAPLLRTLPPPPQRRPPPVSRPSEGMGGRDPGRDPATRRGSCAGLLRRWAQGAFGD